MGTNCAPLLADIFLYLYEAEFIVFALNREETVGVSAQFNIQVHRWCFVHKQPRVWELPGTDVSRWTRDQRHDREQHFCFLPGFTSVDREGRSTSHFHFNFHITNFPFLGSNIPTSPAYGVFISQLYGMPRLAPRMDVLSWGGSDFQISFSNRGTSRNAWNRHWGSFMVDTGILSNNMKFPSR